uniref:UBX domain-containing protein 4 isoform X3 n=1 Tax=Rhizophora mucronata TaxID=61149 RepID=A0A2P2KII5_RHIMU
MQYFDRASATFESDHMMSNLFDAASIPKNQEMEKNKQ